MKAYLLIGFLLICTRLSNGYIAHSEAEGELAEKLQSVIQSKQQFDEDKM